jgi:putative ATP-dependent endonuclease of OLD family
MPFPGRESGDRKTWLERALLLPFQAGVYRLVRAVLDIKLDNEGISVIPIYGVHFQAYSKLFGPKGITKRCAIVADGDLKPSDAVPVEDEDDEDLPDTPKPELESLENDYVSVFSCKTTFERAVTGRGSLPMFIAAAREVGAPRVTARLEAILADLTNGEDDSSALREEARKKVLALAKRVGKARFAQVASKHATLATWLPPYIRKAVEWLKQPSR